MILTFQMISTSSSTSGTGSLTAASSAQARGRPAIMREPPEILTQLFHITSSQSSAERKLMFREEQLTNMSTEAARTERREASKCWKTSEHSLRHIGIVSIQEATVRPSCRKKMDTETDLRARFLPKSAITISKMTAAQRFLSSAPPWSTLSEEQFTAMFSEEDTSEQCTETHTCTSAGTR